jgi:hypothetical protein
MTRTSSQLLTNVLLAGSSTLSKYHPVVIEGMGDYDPRDPAVVAQHIVTQLQRHWSCSDDSGADSEERQRIKDNHQKPKLLITQGDPLRDRGISAITPLVADLLNISRGLVVLDEHIAPYHSPNACRENMIWEMNYSELATVLEDHQPGTLPRLEETIDRYLLAKNERRTALGKPPLKDYFRDFALLQEVTKAGCRLVCGDVTVAHTAQTISDFSVTSFYQAGLELGLVEPKHMVPYAISDELDFELIDKR